MSTNQPPNHSPEEGDGTGAPPLPSTHGASAAPPPPPYGRAPGDYGAQVPEGEDQRQGPAPAPAWNQQAQPGNGTGYGAQGRPPFPPGQPPFPQGTQPFPPGQPPFPQGAPPQGSNPQGQPSGYYQPAPQGQYPPGYYYAADPPKSRLAAGLLGIFLGGLGIHRFYLGYTSIGVVQILVTVFTWGLGAVWGVVEGIMILAGAQSFRTDARGVPLRE